MSLPFTLEQFFGAFVQYNERFWPIQIGLNAMALACFALVFRPGPTASRVVSLVLSFLWAWMAIAYHFAVFTRINPAAWAFGALFLVASAAFAWFGVLTSRLQFRWAGGAWSAAGATLMVFALAVYPVIGHFIGHRYPAAPTFGVPCPTTIFTLGLLLLAARPVPGWVFVVPVLWAVIGSSAAYLLGVLEDLVLLAAAGAALGVLLRDRS